MGTVLAQGGLKTFLPSETYEKIVWSKLTRSIVTLSPSITFELYKLI